jgi:glycosyltransferase involved in cell wall biosynthesis
VLSLVIPVYKNEENLERLLTELVRLRQSLPELEVIFAIDGSPDRCAEILATRLPGTGLRAQLVQLSRNFGSFSAICAGLEVGQGEHFAVIAADLQEPPALIVRFAEILTSGSADIAFGVRTKRADPWLTEVLSGLFWWLYRRFVLPEMPAGGVDVFGCTRQVRDRLLSLREAHTNIVGLLLWLGYRQVFVPYERLARLEGKSSWTFAKKLRYSIDSIFNFTDLPIRFLMAAGMLGTSLSILVAAVVMGAWSAGWITVQGYTPLILAISFFGGLTTLGLGIVGQYLWLALRNTRQRPNYIIRTVEGFEGAADR